MDLAGGAAVRGGPRSQQGERVPDRRDRAASREFYVSRTGTSWARSAFSRSSSPPATSALYQRGLRNMVVRAASCTPRWACGSPCCRSASPYYEIRESWGAPIYSYALGVLGFWTSILFYTLIGAHHFIFSPVPWWLQSAAILFSVGMMVPVWAGGGNLLLTFRDASGSAAAELLRALPPGRRRSLSPRVHSGHARGLPLDECLIGASRT